MNSKPSYLSPQHADLLIQHTKNLKHKTCFLLMLDCGFRVSEAISLRHADFDFKQKTVTIRSLKKGRQAYRTLPLSGRLYNTLAHYIQKYPPTDNQGFLFPGKKPGTHLTRKAINSVCNSVKARYPTLHPHALRHTFAKLHLANGLQLSHLKEMLGHEQLSTTALYLRTNSIDFTIGRNDEIAQITGLINKFCNTILIGPIGIGKSHLIKQIKPEGKTLFIDDVCNIKRALVQCLLYLYKNDKKRVFNLLYGKYDLDRLQQHLQRDSITGLTKEIIKITQRHEYLVVIDSVDRITPRGVMALERLKDHFTILTCAREVPLNRTSFLWNFEVLPIKPLTRAHSLSFIQRLSNGLKIEDFILYRNYIYEQSAGNPRAMVELIDRYKKEAIVTPDVIKDIKHIGSRKEYDMSPFVIFTLGGMSILRYIAYEIGNPSLKLVGGTAFILLIASRYLNHFLKRKFL